MLRHFPTGRAGQARIGVAMALLASLLTVAFVIPAPGSATNDHSHLHHHRSSLNHQIDTQKVDVDEVSTQLVRAQARVDSAVQELTTARSALAVLRVQARAAAVRDQRLQKKLALAVVRLRNARTDLVQGRRDVVDQRSALAGYAISAYQGGGLSALSLGLGLDSQTTQDAVDNMQDLDTIGNKQSVALQRLQAAGVILRLTEQRVLTTKQEVHQQRIVAADNLAAKQRLAREARAAKREVADQVAGLRVQRQQVAAAKQHELRRLNRLENERNRVEARLRAIAERRARRHHAQLTATTAPQTTTTTPKPPKSLNTGGGVLAWPVANTYITSPYGMRMHPILHVYKLHDGTDFHADCGTPVYAAADGTVSDEYFNTGYGNRIIIDHGYVNGVSLWTSYNHLTSFVSGAGEHVQQGELIAYSGTTGYSTGCHLHFMVYVNGLTVDPMTWL